MCAVWVLDLVALGVMGCMAHVWLRCGVLLVVACGCMRGARLSYRRGGRDWVYWGGERVREGR